MPDQPLVSVDVVAVRWDGGALRYAIHHRKFEPFLGELALPGVLLLPGESLEAAARRAVSAKLGLPDTSIRHVTQFGAFDETNRDPRGATIAIGHLAFLTDGPDGEATWVDFTDTAVPLPFDHNTIVTAAWDSLRSRVWIDWPVTRALLGEGFTTGQVITLATLLDHMPYQVSNLARWLAGTGHIEKAGMRGRDTVWRWIERTA
ncbi:NUDIX hydrolase [Leucobacter sp. cx-169]|uniref:NUDIX hydrolase n=1 Tax=Leucobacter sp. cx-169 TaxID=2770549 RepID=UPI00165EB7E2|nr:NUDIX hydrolase [Leucobacter sp. cx-169]MBC9927291.1 NUDIX hydrolase [Leucobacter sp. cx-169]